MILHTLGVLSRLRILSEGSENRTLLLTPFEVKDTLGT